MYFAWNILHKQWKKMTEKFSKCRSGSNPDLRELSFEFNVIQITKFATACELSLLK